MAPRRRRSKRKAPAKSRRFRSHAPTDQQRIFYENWFLTQDGRGSAILAGYSAARAHVTASELLHTPRGLAMKAEVERELEEKWQVTKERVARAIAIIALADRTQVFRIEAGELRIRNTDELTPEARLLINEAKETTTQHGGSLSIVCEPRGPMLKLLAEMLQLVRPDSPFGALVPGKPLIAVPIAMPAQIEA